MYGAANRMRLKRGICVEIKFIKNPLLDFHCKRTAHLCMKRNMSKEQEHVMGSIFSIKREINQRKANDAIDLKDVCTSRGNSARLIFGLACDAAALDDTQPSTFRIHVDWIKSNI